MARSIGEKRAEVIHRMKAAIAVGKSATAFLREVREAGLGYRRTDFLGDWRSVGNVEKKTGLLKYVRKDYRPSPALYAEVTWKTSREYMYKLQVESRLKPDAPLEKRFVNIVSDRPMTPRELEKEVVGMWGGWYPERRDQVETIIPQTAIRRVE